MPWCAQSACSPAETHAVVIGAGVSGLQTARALLKAGVNVTVLEMGVDVGGIWYKNYPGFGLQGAPSSIPHDRLEAIDTSTHHVV
jgi:cation diffusion facilitator CzcD-associated flavoprotein CzcO